MIILALDPAEYKLGWALGRAGTKPVVGVYKLRDKRDERTEDAVEHFAKWLHTDVLFDLLAMEHFLPSGALKGRTTDATREGAIGLNYAARAVCAVKGIHFRSPMPNEIRKHFCGRAFDPGGDTKGMVIRQAQLLGYIPRDCFEDNIADACALYDFASSHFASRAASFALT